MLVRFSFTIVIAIFAIGSMAMEAKDSKKKIKSKEAKKKKSKEAKKTAKPTEGNGGYYSSGGGYYGYGRRLRKKGDRRLSLQYMTERFDEEGSVSSFVDSLGYEVDLEFGTGEKDNALSKKDCKNLMSLIHNSTEEKDSFEDTQKYIDDTELVSIIGKVRIECTN